MHADRVRIAEGNDLMPLGKFRKPELIDLERREGEDNAGIPSINHGQRSDTPLVDGVRNSLGDDTAAGRHSVEGRLTSTSERPQRHGTGENDQDDHCPETSRVHHCTSMACSVQHELQEKDNSVQSLSTWPQFKVAAGLTHSFTSRPELQQYIQRHTVSVLVFQIEAPAKPELNLRDRGPRNNDLDFFLWAALITVCAG